MPKATARQKTKKKSSLKKTKFSGDRSDLIRQTRITRAIGQTRTPILLTKAKIKRAVSANLKGFATKKHYRNLTVKYFEMPASF